ncbi:MAG: protocatechuate 3,4-dioxygenase subunit alpha [Flavobacteriaceae bacterium]
MPVKYLKETPSQTAGPYVHIGTVPRVAGLETRTQEKLNVSGLGVGEPIVIEGVIHDGGNQLVRDAVLEIWQADGKGHFDTTGHKGWARAHCDLKTGEYRFETVKPGKVAWHDGRMQAPHITLMIFARGMNIQLQTRIYFDDEAQANATCPVLTRVPAGQMRDSLIARRQGEGTPLTYRFEVRCQGPEETAFFDI